MLQLFAVLCAGGDNINAGGVDAGMAKQVGQLGNILFQGVKGTGKQVAQVVGKHLFGVYPGGLAQAFHLSPNSGAADRLAGAGDKDGAGGNILLGCIAQQLFLQLFY